MEAVSVSAWSFTAMFNCAFLQQVTGLYAFLTLRLNASQKIKQCLRLFTAFLWCRIPSSSSLFHHPYPQRLQLKKNLFRIKIITVVNALMFLTLLLWLYCMYRETSIIVGSIIPLTGPVEH